MNSATSNSQFLTFFDENQLLNPAFLFAEQLVDVAVLVFSLNVYVWNIWIGCCIQHTHTHTQGSLHYLGKMEAIYFLNATVT